MQLSPELEKYVEKLIESGKIKNADELVLFALKLRESEEKFLDQNKEWIKEKIREGRDSDLIDLDKNTINELRHIANTE